MEHINQFQTSPIKITRYEILVDMVNWIAKDYNWIVNPVLLYDIIIKNHQGQKLRFVFNDGESIRLTGALEFIKKIKKDLFLPTEMLTIEAYDDIELDWATFNQIKRISFMHHERKVFPINNSTFDKKFLAMFGRFTIHRLLLTKFMHDNYKDDSLLGFNTGWDVVEWDFTKLVDVRNFYSEELHWAKNNLPLVISEDIHSKYKFLRTVNWMDSMLDHENLCDKYFIEVTSETDVWNPYFITEKTTRSFMFGKPFVTFSAPGTLKFLQEMGYKTFSPWFNESYDEIENTVDRFEAVKTEITRLSTFSIQDLRTMATEMQSVLEHNQQMVNKF